MNASSHVTEIEHGGRRLTIVGTAHISRKSVAEVERVISELVPDVVCVELDRSRYEALANDGAIRHIDLGEVIEQRHAPFVLASLLLTSFQRRLGQRLGVMPGAELIAAVRAAERIGARVVLADRDIHVTLSRTWARLSLWNKAKLAVILFLAFSSGGEITEEQVEELKDRENVADALDQLARAMPALKESLIDERDRYLMSSVRSAPGQKIVAVVGAGHVAGMLTHLDDPIDRQALARMPTPSPLGVARRWLAAALVPGLFVTAAATRPLHVFDHLVWIWSVCTVASVGLFAAAARANPLTWVVSVLCAPMTCLAPGAGAARLAGFMEARLRKPQAHDLSRLREDILTLRGTIQNPFSRVLIVSWLTGWGAAVGALGGAIAMLVAL